MRSSGTVGLVFVNYMFFHHFTFNLPASSCVHVSLVSSILLAAILFFNLLTYFCLSTEAHSGLNVYIPQNSYVEILTLNVMYLERRDLKSPTNHLDLTVTGGHPAIAEQHSF